MLPVKGTVLLEFQLLLGIPPIFAGGIIAPLAFTALQGNQFNHLLFSFHYNLFYI
jgi:hypothetical protein